MPPFDDGRTQRGALVGHEYTGRLSLCLSGEIRGRKIVRNAEGSCGLRSPVAKISDPKPRDLQAIDCSVSGHGKTVFRRGY